MTNLDKFQQVFGEPLVPPENTVEYSDDSRPEIDLNDYNYYKERYEADHMFENLIAHAKQSSLKMKAIKVTIDEVDTVLYFHKKYPSISQRDLGKIVGLSVYYVRKILNGEYAGSGIKNAMLIFAKTCIDVCSPLYK